jgi:hypothetical protein
MDCRHCDHVDLKSFPLDIESRCGRKLIKGFIHFSVEFCHAFRLFIARTHKQRTTVIPSWPFEDDPRPTCQLATNSFLSHSFTTDWDVRQATGSTVLLN